MKALADRYLSNEAITAAGLLDADGGAAINRTVNAVKKPRRSDAKRSGVNPLGRCVASALVQ